MNTIKKYLSLIKFSHTIFAMPFALIGFFLGWRFEIDLTQSGESGLDVLPDSRFFYMRFLQVVLCMIFARSAAMSFNRYLDHKIDAKNSRTATREIPSGVIRPGHALLFTILCCLLFVLTTYFINLICFRLSFVALFVILFYSYTKRITALCHLVLGLGLSLAPTGAFLALTGVFDWLPVLFSILVLTWVSGFDIIYALQDEEFDKQNNLNSIPVLLGKKGALYFSIFLHVVTAALILLIGFYHMNASWFWMGGFLFVAMLIYQHSIVRPNDLSKVNLAFMTANGIASVVFSIFVIIQIITSS